MEMNGKAYGPAFFPLPAAPTPNGEHTKQREENKTIRNELAISLFLFKKCLRQTLVARNKSRVAESLPPELAST